MKAISPLGVFWALLILARSAWSAPMYTVTDLGPSWQYSAGFSVNAGGQVTGQFSYFSADYAFLYDGTMNSLGALGTFGNRQSVGRSINTSGEVAGYSDIYFGFPQFPIIRTHAFLFDGTMNDLGTLGGDYSYAYGINDAGEVTGSAQTAGNMGSPAFIYDGTIHSIGTLGGTLGTGYSINSKGHAAGSASTAGNAASHAFLYDGTMHDLGSLGGGNSSGLSINANDMVVGQSEDLGHAFVYDGTMHDIGTLGGSTSTASGINDNGQVVGDSDTPAGGQHAFYWDATHAMVDLNSLISPASGWTLQAANGINNAGQITGYGLIGGETHAFILNSVPEPSAGLLAALACGMICLCRRHRIARRGVLRNEAGSLAGDKR